MRTVSRQTNQVGVTVLMFGLLQWNIGGRKTLKTENVCKTSSNKITKEDIQQTRSWKDEGTNTTNSY